MRVPRGIKAGLRRWGLRGPLRPLAQWSFETSTAFELAVERALDRRFVPPVLHGGSRGSLRERITVLIKTFERPHVLRRMVSSVRRSYPDVPILVVDDSRTPSRLEGVSTIEMAYDSGVSAGRNAGLARVGTPYVLVADDDFIFHRHTDLARVLETMDAHPVIDVVGGDVVDLPFYEPFDVARAAIFPTEAPGAFPDGHEIGGLPVVDKVPNFFVARTPRLRLVPWDPLLKKVEHADFFTRARGVLVTVFDVRFRCLHGRTPFDAAYHRHRDDVVAEQRLLDERYGRRRRAPA